MLIFSPETSHSAESVEALTIEIGWPPLLAAYGRLSTDDNELVKGSILSGQVQ